MTALPWWKKALFAFCACAIFFGGAELLLWGVGVETVLESEDPFRGFSGLVSVFERDGEHYRTVRIEGPKTFNDQSFLATKPPNGIRAFVLGGSSAYGFPWGHESSFAAWLGEALALEHPDRHVEVVNVAAVSYAMHRIRILVRELVRYQPDLIVIYSGHNEFVERGHYEALREQSVTLNRLRYWLSHSRLYSLLWRAKGERTAAALGAVVQRDESRQFSAEEKAAVVQDFESTLHSVVRLARQAGSRVLLSTVPANVAEWRPRASRFGHPLDAEATVEWAQSVESARALLAAERVDEARQAIDRALALAPSHAETRYLSAEIYRAAGEWPAAREAYRQACDLDASPTRASTAVNEATRRVAREEQTLFVDSERLFEELSPQGLVGLGLVEDYVHPTREGHVHIAWAMLDTLENTGWWGPPSTPDRAAFDAIVASREPSADTRNATWLFNQAILLKNQRRVAEAIAKFREAIRLSPNYAGAMANLALLLVETGELDEARQMSEELLRNHPRHPRGLLVRGAVLYLEGRNDAAAEALSRALEIDPDLADAHVLLGQLRLQQGAPDDAERHLRRALVSDPENAQASISLGQVEESRGRPAEAEARYRGAIAVQPQSGLAHARLAALVAAEGRPDEAASLFRAAKTLAGDDPQSTVDVAKAFIEARRFDDAIELLESAARRGVSSARMHTLHGYALNSLHREREALPHFEQAAALVPNSLSAVTNLGVVQLKLGKAAEAERSFRRAIVAHGQSSDAHSHLGVALAVQGKWDEAALAFQEAVRLDPNNAVARQRLQEAQRRQAR